MHTILLNILIILILIDSIYLYLTKNLFKKMVLEIQNSDLQIRLESGLMVYLLITNFPYLFHILIMKSLFKDS